MRSYFCYVARALLSFVVGLFGVFHCLRPGFWRRPNSIHPSNIRENNRNSHLLDSERARASEIQIRPCIERLEQLEKAFEVLRNKPPGIPLEKEQMLLESLERIRSVELDLEKTKSVSLFLLLDV